MRHNRRVPAHRTDRHACHRLAAPWPGVHVTDLESGRHFGRHSHDTHGLGQVVAGAQQSASGRGALHACAGTLIPPTPGEVHDGRPLGGASRRWRMVYLSPEAMAAFGGTPHLAILQPVMRAPRLGDALDRLFARVFGRDDPLAAEEALVDVIGCLRDGHTTALPLRPADASVDAVRERLADPLLPPATLQDLADLCGLSRFQVLRRFEKLHGLPPHAWRLQLHTERARTLIGRGHALADAAAAAGFATQSPMPRPCVRQSGYTPGAWRAAAA